MSIQTQYEAVSKIEKTINDGKFVIGYITHDDCCENPLEGTGYNLYTTRRGSDGHSEFAEALGLNDDFAPDLERIVELPAFRSYWLKEAARSGEWEAWCDRTGRKTDPDAGYYQRRAKLFWRDISASGEHYRDQCHWNLWDFDFTATAAQKLWETGVIQDPYAVKLDCYQHGCEVWSISGTGMQCRWDTARGVGVLVPDEESRKRLDQLKLVYAFGEIVKKPNGWLVFRDYSFGFTSDPTFPSWQQAWEYLVAFSEKYASGRTPEMEQEGLARACEYMAESLLDSYNAWLSGDCYGVVIEQFTNSGSESEPCWELISDEAVWGFVGEDWAQRELQDQIDTYK